MNLRQFVNAPARARQFLYMVAFSLIVASVGLASVAGAQDQPPAASPEDLFTGAKSGSNAQLDYRPFDAVLANTVWPVGRSDRKPAKPIQAQTGTRFSLANNSKTRNEGNRIFYHLMTEEDKQALANFSLDLQAIPGWIDMARLNKDEQLAFWLNLYNVTLIDQITRVYPMSDLSKLRKMGLFDKKLMTIRGLGLSLDDIRDGVLSHWESPLVIYGMFQGTVGGPNIRRMAYRGHLIWEQLADNAAEFVNSLRGTQFSKDTLRVSEIYEWNSHRFASDQALKDHILAFAEGDVKTRTAAASRIKRDIYDWHIADLYNGQLGGSSVANSQAAQLDMWETPKAGAGETAAAGAGANLAGQFNPITGLIARTTMMPDHAVELFRAVTLRYRERATNVNIYDVSDDTTVEVPEDDEDKGDEDKGEDDKGNK